MKLAILASVFSNAHGDTHLNHRQVYQQHWQEDASNWQHASEPVDTVRHTSALKKDEKYVVWKRCAINGGTVYKRRGGEVRHPTPVIVRCLPGYELRKEGKKHERNNILCKAGELNFWHGTKIYQPATDLKCEKLPPKDAPKWRGTPACPLPINDDLKYEVIDAFEKNGKYGFVFELSVPAKLSGYSIALEYPTGAKGANMQTWNLNYFGFYAKYVVFHPGTNPVEGDDHRKSVIVIEGLESLTKPEFHLFDKVITDHRCFKSDESMSRRNNDKWFVETKKLSTESDVKMVKVDRASGWVWPQ